MNKKPTTLDIILRILFWPFILCMCLIRALIDSTLILRYGGEFFSYKKGDRKLIYDIFEELKKQREENGRTGNV